MRQSIPGIFWFLSVFLGINAVSAQSTSRHFKEKGRLGFGMSVEAGSVFIQSASVNNVKKSHPFALSFDVSSLRTDSNSFRLFRTYIRKGYSLTIVGFGSPVLGHGILASTFLEPIYRIGKRIQFEFRGDLGLGYLSNPYDSILNPKNNNYSMHFTPYIRLGAGLAFQVSDHLTASTMLSMRHLSNGNYKQPNAGLNLAMYSFTLLYYPQSNRLPHYRCRANKDWKSFPTTVDLGWMFVPRQDYVSKNKSQRNFMTGFFTQVTKQVSDIESITIGAEGYYNNFSNDPNAPPQNTHPALLSGIHIGHEFLLGRWVFSQQLGKYVTSHPPFYPDIYHRWGLRYRVVGRYWVGFNLKAHGKTADFIDMRVQYRF